MSVRTRHALNVSTRPPFPVPRPPSDGFPEQGCAGGTGAVVGASDGRGWRLPPARDVPVSLGAARSYPGELIFFCALRRDKHFVVLSLHDWLFRLRP